MSDDVPLLNSTSDLAVAHAMVGFADALLADAERRLTTTQLDREDYIAAFSRARVLREVALHHRELYRRATAHQS